MPVIVTYNCLYNIGNSSGTFTVNAGIIGIIIKIEKAKNSNIPSSGIGYNMIIAAFIIETRFTAAQGAVKIAAFPFISADI